MLLLLRSNVHNTLLLCKVTRLLLDCHGVAAKAKRPQHAAATAPIHNVTSTTCHCQQWLTLTPWPSMLPLHHRVFTFNDCIYFARLRLATPPGPHDNGTVYRRHDVMQLRVRLHLETLAIQYSKQGGGKIPSQIGLQSTDRPSGHQPPASVPQRTQFSLPYIELKLLATQKTSYRHDLVGQTGEGTLFNETDRRKCETEHELPYGGERWWSAQETQSPRIDPVESWLTPKQPRAATLPNRYLSIFPLQSIQANDVTELPLTSQIDKKSPNEKITVSDELQSPNETITVSVELQSPNETITVSVELQSPNETITVSVELQSPNETVTVSVELQSPNETITVSVELQSPNETITVSVELQSPNETITVSVELQSPNETITVSVELQSPNETITVSVELQSPNETITVSIELQLPDETITVLNSNVLL
ncbi:hypothetical protein J6590_023505 [Homalodisca vitripennis]|nr:hypothetical protein J6590_023505 [Homalodisca vitripennis]